MLDLAIVGGGIAGMYTAMLAIESSPTSVITIYEKSHRVGGRLGNVQFQGASVVYGAGVGRLEKDVRLAHLLDTVGIEYGTSEVKRMFAPTVKSVDIGKCMDVLRKAQHAKLAQTRFKAFAKGVLGAKAYDSFVQATGYTDYERSDVTDVLYNYGMDDNAGGWHAMHIPWTELTHTMKTLLRARGVTFKFGHDITKIEACGNDGFSLSGVTPDEPFATKARVVVVATTIESLRRLFDANPIYRAIHGQPFMRLYGRFAKATVPVMKSLVPYLTVVPSPLQEIIPIVPDKGIYMIGYADNQAALFLKEIGQDKAALEKLVYSSLDVKKDDNAPITILKTLPIFWDIGTHYYDPLPKSFSDRQAFIDKAQRPLQGKKLYVVGEVVAIHQGWSEGALQSVTDIIDDLIAALPKPKSQPKPNAKRT